MFFGWNCEKIAQNLTVNRFFFFIPNCSVNNQSLKRPFKHIDCLTPPIIVQKLRFTFIFKIKTIFFFYIYVGIYDFFTVDYYLYHSILI